MGRGGRLVLLGEGVIHALVQLPCHCPLHGASCRPEQALDAGSSPSAHSCSTPHPQITGWCSGCGRWWAS